jgi:hypothetical protein
MSFAR